MSALGDEIEALHRDYLLTALRAAAVRAKLMECDLNTIGVALKGGLIGTDTAVRWVREAGLLGMVGSLPETVGKVDATFAPFEGNGGNGFDNGG